MTLRNMSDADGVIFMPDVIVHVHLIIFYSYFTLHILCLFLSKPEVKMTDDVVYHICCSLYRYKAYCCSSYICLQIVRNICSAHRMLKVREVTNYKIAYMSVFCISYFKNNKFFVLKYHILIYVWAQLPRSVMLQYSLLSI